MLTAISNSRFAGRALMAIAFTSALSLAALFPTSALAQRKPLIAVPLVKPSVTTYHNNNQRTGVSANENAFTTGIGTNLSADTFGKLWTRPIDGSVYAQPLYVPCINFPNLKDLSNQPVGVYNAVFVCTTHNSIYAFDGGGSAQIKNPASASFAVRDTPLWKINFNSPNAGVVPVSEGDVQSGDISPEIGIIGTPVIDSRINPKTGYSTGTMYVVVKTKEGGNGYAQKLHAIDIATGAERFDMGSPLTISASVDGNGDGSLTDDLGNSYVPFDPLMENQQAALTLVNAGTADATLYIAWGSHGDVTPYHGWVMSFNANTLTPKGVFNSSPNRSNLAIADGGGIWGGGAGPAVDATGCVYVATGAGDFNADPVAFTGGTEYGNSVLKLSFEGPIAPPPNGGVKTNGRVIKKKIRGASSPLASVLDYFTPFNWSELSASQTDLGAGGIVLLPDVGNTTTPNLLVAAGKEGKIYLINRNGMGGFTFGTDNVVQTLDNAVGEIYGVPAFLNNTLYYQGTGDQLKAFKFENGLLNPIPSSVSSHLAEYPGATPVITTSPDGANAIVWTLERTTFAPYVVGFPLEIPVSVLHAYDANDVSKELYSGFGAGMRDVPGTSVQFTLPTIANGRAYVASENSFTAYGFFAANGVKPKPTQAHHFIVTGPLFGEAGVNVPQNVNEWYSVTAIGPDGAPIKLNSNIHLSWRNDGDAALNVIKTLQFRNDSNVVFNYAFDLAPGRGFPIKDFFISDDDGHSNLVENWEQLPIFPSVFVNQSTNVFVDHFNVTGPPTAKTGSKVNIKITVVTAKNNPVPVNGNLAIFETLPDGTQGVDINSPGFAYNINQPRVRLTNSSVGFAQVTVHGVGNHVFIVTAGQYVGTILIKGVN